ncbi:MAG: hotdog domain-containing protein [Nitrososphaerota archaeon]
MRPLETYSQTTRIVMPRHANPLGVLFGGNMLSWLIESSTSSAMTVASGKGEVVLGFMDEVYFLNPVRVGSRITYRSWVGHVGRSSVSVFTEALIWREGNAYEVACTSKAIYVCVGSDRRPRPLNATLEPVERWEGALMERMGSWRRRAEDSIRALRWERRGVVKHQLVSYRRITPEDTIAGDLLFAGRLMQFMDEVAGILALRFANAVTVTASVDQTFFVAPITVNEAVRLEARLTRVWRSSMEVEVDAHRLGEDGEVLASRAYFTMVKMDITGPGELPAYAPMTPEEHELWEEAGRRRERRETALSSLRELRGRPVTLDPGSPVPALAELI